MAVQQRGRMLLAQPEYCDVRDWERHGGVVLYAAGVAYMILGLIIINNHYFMPALRRLSRRLRLSDNVAGATIFAGGSSAPFVFFGFFSLLAPSSAIPTAVGIASTVGAGATNVLGVIGAAGALCMARDAPDAARKVHWYPLMRDASFWAVTILTLGGMAADGAIHWWEGLLMVALYVVYVGLNASNPAVLAALERRRVARRRAARPTLPTPSRHGAESAHMADSAMDIVDETAASSAKRAAAGAAPRQLPMQKSSIDKAVVAPEVSAHQKPGGQQRALPLAERGSAADLAALADPHTDALVPADLSDGAEEAEEARRPTSAAEAGASASISSGIAGNGDAVADSGDADGATQAVVVQQEAEEVEEAPAFSQLWPPQLLWQRLLWGLCLPWYVALAVTVPDCRAPRLRRLYLVTATLAIAWIGGDSWLLLVWTLKVGCVAHAPLAVMGATVLAIGSTMLTALVSFAVAAQGKAEMSIANAIGSSVFNVLIGLGLPYFIVQAARGKPAAIDTAGLWPDIGVLLVTLTAFLGLMVAARLRLSRAVGWTMLALYVIYIIYIVLTAWVFDAFGVRDA